MNIVLDEAFEEKQGGEKVAIGMVVSTGIASLTYIYKGRTLTAIKVIRGNSVVMLEVSLSRPVLPSFNR